jgi:uncharacterized protein
MKDLTLSLSDFLETDVVEIKNHRYKGDIGVKTDIFVSLKALRSSKKSIYINGIITGFVEIECSRCLNLYRYKMDIPMNTDIDVIDGQVDIGEEVRQSLLLEIPMKPICDKDCLGICKVCGRHNKKNDFCNCSDNTDGLVKERWKELLNNKWRK